MNGPQIQRAIDKLQLSQLGFGRLMKVDGRTVRKWVAGTQAPPASARILLTLLLQGKITIEDVEAAAAPAPRARGRSKTLGGWGTG